MGKRSLLMVVSCALLAAAVAVPASASAKRTLLIGNCAKPKFKPATVIFTCGDASFGATSVTWSSWTKKSAAGTGTGQINDCNPSCVQGQVKTAPIELRASKPRKCGNGVRLYTKVSFTWTAGAPTGRQSGSVGLGCKVIGGI